MLETLDEKIKVGVVFEAGTAKPVWFARKGRKHAIKEITYRWKDKEGDAVLNYFSVTDGENLYELVFNTKTLVWCLSRVEVEG